MNSVSTIIKRMSLDAKAAWASLRTLSGQTV